MKKIYSKLMTACIAVGSFTGIQAQTIDVGVSNISRIQDNETILPGFESRVIQVELSNFDAANTVETENIGIRFNFNQNDSNSINLQGPALAASAVVNVQPLAFDMTGRLQPGANRLCAYTFPRGGATDSDHSNDSTCISLNYDNNATMDIAANSVAITGSSPAAEPDGRYRVGTIITEIQATFANESSVTITEGNRIPYTIKLDLASQDLVGTLQSDLPVSETTTRTINDAGLLPALPGVPGEYELCATSRLSSDNNAANNETCITVEVYDPSTSVEEVEKMDNITAYYNNDRIIVDFVSVESQKVDVFVHSLTGQLITQKTTGVAANIQERIEVPFNFAQGLYIVTVASQGQVLKTDKVAIR